MALTVAQAFMNEVQTILLDPTGSYWTTQYLINAYNIIVTAIIKDNPNALTKIVPFTCAAGVDQICPADAVQFLRAPANVNGPTIRQVQSEALQEDDNEWYATPQTAIVEHIVPDEFDPLRFRVYPGNNGSGSINLQYAYAPSDITSLSDTFLLTEAYRIDCRNGVLGMAYGLNTDRQDLTKMQYYTGLLPAGVQAAVQAQNALAARVGTTQTSE